MAHKEGNKYFEIRDQLGYSRAKVEELSNNKISADRLYRIEEGKTPNPEEVCWMADLYGKPELKNYYCNHECEIGRTNGIDGVGDVEKSKLPLIILELLSSLNSIQKEKLIDISADGEIDENELNDFIEIRNQLDKISQTVESLRIWADKHIEK